MGNYVLGLDLGASSLGWVAIELKGREKSLSPTGILDAGVRIFEAGVEGAIEQGKDSSRGAKRREARQPRRQQWRRQQRKRRLFSLLQKLGLLPPSEGNGATVRKTVIDDLDATLRPTNIALGDHLQQQKLPYILRARAASERVSPFELGRALYHLGQRRGYLSNRKGQDDDDREGAVSTGISEIDIAKGDKTLGEFFAEDVDVFKLTSNSNGGGRDPRKGRIRKRYTARAMYRQEFSQIRETQAAAHANLSVSDWNDIEQALFFQRPLKSQKHLIGRCELEPNRRGCPEALPIFQEFRVLQAVNHLIVRMPDCTERPLTDDERQRLVDTLQDVQEMSLKSKAKTTAKLPKGASFTLEEWQDKLVGNRTNAKMKDIFGSRWAKMSRDEQNGITLEVLHYRKPQSLINRAMEAWGLDREQAEALSRVRLEEGYASHSRQALEKLVAAMQDGTPYSTAKSNLYPESMRLGKPLDKLPPVTQWNVDLRNPAVVRALTELRKVVNALIHKYGKPTFIRIELARDLKNSRDKRKDIWRKNEENRKRREKAVKRILEETGISNPSRNDIEKWLLAEEARFECLYCGKHTAPSALFGSSPFDIEHIYPRRFLDNSYVNKTIACRECNHRKGDRTPAEVFHGEEWEQILQRVANFEGPLRYVKLERFKRTPELNDFVSRDLNDTRYNSRLAAKFLATLYGGRSDELGIQRIFTPTGGLTALIRSAWGLNGLLSDGNYKNRDDIRHHAVDALVVALSDQGLVHQLSNAAQQFAYKTDRDRAFLSGIKEPWTGFIAEARAAINAIHVSHRATRTLAGPLHAESIYSKAIPLGKKEEFRIRKELHKLSTNEIIGDQIADPTIRRLVQQKYEELGGGQPAKVFSDPANHPTLPTKDGRQIPIHKVRIRASVTPRKIGKGPRERNVASGKDSNFASLVYAILDSKGQETKWVHEILTRLEAHERLSANHNQRGEKVLIPDQTDESRQFKFALVKNDMLLLEGPNGEDVLYRVQSFSQSEIQLCEHNISAVRGDLRTTWNRITSVESLRKRNARPVELSPLGEIRLR